VQAAAAHGRLREPHTMHAPIPSVSSVETRQSWLVAFVALIIMSLVFGSGWITSVALTDIAAEAGGARSIPAVATSFLWLGAGIGGVLMGRVANRFGMRLSVVFGAFMVGGGLAISTLGPPTPLWIGHAIFMGLLGIGAINAPMYVYISNWFDKRRGSALALISSGSYFAGTLWPPVFERSVSAVGWRTTMLLYGGFLIVMIVPLALAFLKPPPQAAGPQVTGSVPTNAGTSYQVTLPANVVFLFLCAAGLLCCVPMAMPQQHLVAFCGDLGISRATGALMLSVLLGAAFASRQVWGVVSDRIGGLKTIFISSIAQAVALTGFLLTQTEAGLFFVAAAFGLGFSALIPAYALAVRDLFPASEAYWRVPTVLLCTAFGMAIGGWLAGYLYDHFGSYAPAFATGVAANVLNFTIIGVLVARQSRRLA
jgi:MFS family permease